MALPLTPEQVKDQLRAAIRTSPLDPPRSNTAVSVLEALVNLVDTLSIKTWQPLFGMAADGDRLCWQVVDWQGGVGPKPVNYTGSYLGVGGYVAGIADAVDTRGRRGWSPVYAIESRGTDRVWKLTDYSGGEGPKPTAGIGQYVGPAGLVTDVLGAVNVRGVQGIQGVPGSRWFTGTVTPIAASAPNAASFAPNVDGAVPHDVYLRTDTGDIYKQLGSGTWSLQAGNLRGPQGIQGIQGNKGDKGDPGTLTASAFVVQTSKIIAGADRIVVQQADGSLKKYDFQNIAAVPAGYQGSISDLGDAGNIMALLMNRYADAWQAKPVTKVEKWNPATSAWDVQPATVLAQFQRLMRGRPVSSGIQMAPDERYRIYITASGASYARMLGIVTQYAQPRVDAVVTLDQSFDNGISYTQSLLAATAVPFCDYFYTPTNISYGGFHRLTIAINADGDSTKRYHLGGLSFFTGRISGENPIRNTLPLWWNERNAVLINTETTVDDPDPSAALEILSTKGGVLFPRMNTAQRDAIPNAKNGLLTYITDAVKGFSGFVDGVWQRLITGKLIGGVEVVELPGRVQFPATTANRRVVLYQSADNDHQYYGFGVNGSTLRYQLLTDQDSHVFYAGLTPITSKEIMRIMGNGKVAIGEFNDPSSRLEVRDANPIGGNILTLTNVSQTGRTGVFQVYHQGGIAIWKTGLPADADAFVILGWGNGANPERLRIDNNGSVGIGTPAPSATLHVNGVTGHQQLRLEKSFTPSGPTDSRGLQGHVAWDDNFLYVKTSHTPTHQWKRTALQSW